MDAKNLSDVILSVTKPRGKPALLLAESGVNILPLEGDEGNVDRYILSKRVAVERRTGSSFLRGIMDKTLFTSAIYLREHYEIPILIIEGAVNYAYTSFNPQAVRGALSSMMMVYGLNILSTPDVEESVALINMIARHEQGGVPLISLIPKRKAVDTPDLQRRIIEMLPGCGMVMARDLLGYFGSVNRIMNASETELRAVRGIGAKKASEIYNVLNSEYESVDTEKQLEDAIETAPELLFSHPVNLLSRQHYIYSQHGERFFVDLVFLDPEANEIILVELKRGKLTREHEEQLLRYLDKALQSPLLRSFLEDGVGIRGVLATVEARKFKPGSPAICVHFMDRARTISVLKRLRNERLQKK
jgi:ERCC4-type nuclease